MALIDGFCYLKDTVLKSFNLLMKAKGISSPWGKGHISHIYKSGDKLDPGNYRGIYMYDKLYIKVFPACCE